MKVYFVHRPTAASSTIIPQTQKDPFKLFICLSPSYNPTAMKNHGYPVAEFLYRGIDDNHQFIGWDGVLKNDPNIVFADMAVGTEEVKNHLWLYTKISGTEWNLEESVNLTTVKMAFKGNCYATPVFEQHIGEVLLRTGDFLLNQSVTQLEILVRNPVTSVLFLDQSFDQTGNQLRVNLETDPGFENFRVEGKVFQHTKDDPNFPCREYNNEQTFDTCVQNEVGDNLYQR